MTRRARSRDLAMAYYRLVRALRTGTTIADPRKPEPAYVTLDLLAPRIRRPRLRPGGCARTVPSTRRPRDQSEPESGEARGRRRTTRTTRARTRRSTGSWSRRSRRSPESRRRLERAAEDEIRIALDQLGPSNLESKLDDIDTTAPADDVDAARDEAHRQAGARQAAAAERVVAQRSARHGVVQRHP